MDNVDRNNDSLHDDNYDQLSSGECRKILENMIDIYYRTDKDGKLTIISPSAATVYGVDSVDDLIGKNASDFYYNPSDRIEILEKLYTNGQLKKQVELRNKKGEIKYFEINSKVIRDEYGEISGVEGIMRDVTERRLTEIKLQKSEARFRSTFENAAIGMVMVGLNGKFIKVNNAFCSIINYSVKELEYMSFRDIFLPEDIKNELTSFRAMMNGEYDFYNEEKRLINSKANFVWVMLNVSIVKNEDNSPAYFIAQVQNITKRKKAVSEYKKYKIITDKANYGVAITNLDGTLVYTNEYYARIHGYRVEYLKGKSFMMLHSRKQLPEIMQIRETLIRHGNVEAVEIWKKDKNGKIFPMLMSANVWEEPDTKQKYIVSTAIDISKFKKAEKKLIEAQRMDSIGNLAGGIAHDFNNLLGGMLGYASILSKKLSEPELIEYSESIEKAALNARELTNKLLAFGRRSEKIIVPINLNQLIDEVLIFLKYTTTKKISVEKNLDENLYEIKGDQNQISQVILNLCVNSIDAIEDRGAIKITTKNMTSITKETDDNQNQVLIEIEDDGIGIDHKIAKRIFEPFFSTKKNLGNNNSGLGLSTVYGIVKQHNGKVKVKSRLGEGSIFTITLPATTKVTSKYVEEFKKIKNGSEKILIVDDEKMILNMAKRMIENMGYSTICCNSASEAIESYKKKFKEIDLVILDIQMPEMNGRDLFKELEKINPNIKTIASSGYGDNNIAENIQDIGINKLLPKPYTISEMSNTIREILDIDKN